MEFSLPSHRLDFGRNPHFLSGISNFASFQLQTALIDCQPWYSTKQNTTTTTHGDKNEKRSSRSLLCAKNLLCKVLAGRQGRALVVIINSTTLTYQTCSKHAAEERKSLFLHEGRNNEHHLWSFSALLKLKFSIPQAGAVETTMMSTWQVFGILYFFVMWLNFLPIDDF